MLQVTENQEDNIDKFSLPVRYRASFGNEGENSIWDEYAQLITEHKPVNLGIAYQDFPVPEHVTKALSNIASGDDYLVHQYTHDHGHPRLVKILSKLYSQLTGHEINPTSDILITSGAYEALYCSIEGHIVPGDEVIIIEPFFPCFETMVKCAGGIPVFVNLHCVKPLLNTVTSNDWVLDSAELTSKFNSRTKAIILNTPHNPLATFPGMWERTVTIGSAGKVFGVSGWKIGWAYGPGTIIKNLIVVHLNSVFTSPTPLQEAIAQALELELTRFGQPDSYLQTLAKELEVKRDFMVKFLSDAGMVPVIPDGGCFMLANWTTCESKLNLPSESDDFKDILFTKWLLKHLKIFCLPSSVYYNKSSKQVGAPYVRWCFIKKDETINKAASILKLWKDNDFKVII